jgi:hypothetical protein
MEFKPDLGVYVCPHVFDRSRPVLDSIRDFDGSWQFLCGVEGCIEDGEPHHVGVGHLASTDSTLNELTVLKPGMYAERSEIKSRWEFGELQD